MPNKIPYKVMVSFAHVSTSTNLSSFWDQFITKVAMRDEMWPRSMDVWKKMDPTWGWIESSYMLMNQDTIELMNAVMIKYGFKISVENKTVLVYRPSDPTKIPYMIMN